MNVRTGLAVVAVAILAMRGVAYADASMSKDIGNALIALQAHLDVAGKAMGEDGAQALGKRLADDLENIDGAADAPAGYTQDDWAERLRRVSALDEDIVAQVLSGKRAPLAGAHGLVERLLVSRVDGTLQPIALYVPQTLGPDPALVVLLHGHPQTETEILGAPYFRALADKTNTIIAAPWGRGFYDFYGMATDDVYQTADDVAAAYGVRSTRVFLAGYSMGGFSVFRVGPVIGSRWAAVLCISGAIVNSQTAPVVKAFRNTPIYVVNGKLDDSIPSRYGVMTAQYLAGMGIPTGLYQEPQGTHMVSTLVPSLTAAWNDMLAGKVRNTPTDAAQAFALPQMLPESASLKP